MSALLTATACAGFGSTSANATTVTTVSGRFVALAGASTAARGSLGSSQLSLSNPSVSLPPTPNFTDDGLCVFVALDNSDACNQDVVDAIDNARAALESLPPLALSAAAYYAMTVPEQLFVTVNLERLARGASPIAGLTTQLDTVAQTGANNSSDPSLNGISQLTGGASMVRGGGNWAAGTSNPLGSDYYWMYDDGGPSAWGHRDNILGGYATGLCGSSGVQNYMGAGYTTGGSVIGGYDYGPSFTEVFIGACGPPPTDVVFTWPQALQLLDAARIASVTPAAGPLTGGQTVTVTGSGFAPGMSVTIGGTSVTPTGVSATSFTFITPAELAGSVPVQVTTSFGSSALTPADRYTYGTLPVITSVTPSAGPVTGGQTVTVTGSSFVVGMTATIGGIVVTPRAVSAASFTFTTPAEAAGTVQVRVTTLIGATAISPADEYTYVTQPVISTVTPSAGPVTGGQTVTVTGSGFVAGMTATIGGTAVTPSSITASSFTFTTPAEPVGYDQVQVTNLAGTSALTTVTGYIYSGLGSFVPVTPFRILDTRSGRCGIHTCGALGAGQTLALQITGYTDARTGESVPTDATAVVLNVLAVNGSAPSLLTVYPGGTGRPLASDLNFSAHENIANLVTVALGQTGISDAQREVNIYNAFGTLDVVVDVEGYFVPQTVSNPAGEFHAIAPLRVCDTRANQPANGCNLGHSTDDTIGPGQVFKVNVTGIPSGVGGSPASIPSDGSAGAAMLNVTAVAGTQATWLSVFPTQSNGACLTSAPASSTINVSAGGVLANRVMVPLGPSHSGGPSTDVCVYNAAGAINVALDAGGWFGSSSGTAPAGAQYQAIGPTRICDTRSGAGTECSGHQLTSGGTLLVAVAGVGGIPGSGPVAIIGNLTAVNGSQSTYLTMYPADVNPRPNASDVNVNSGIALPNLVVVSLASGAHAGDVNLFNDAGSIDAVVDVDGWFQ
ncbi:MAG: IPT/TIG domain-containing protein [Candidatus Dormiibacterota bacterium]